MSDEKAAVTAVALDQEKNEPVDYQDTRLQQLGYKAELKRSFGTWDMIGLSFGIVNSWAALVSVLIVGIVAGGPPVVLWGFLGVFVITLFVAYAFAEMCSAYPVAGGQYSWVAILSPPSCSRPLSYMTGWFMNAGIIGINSGNWLLTMNFFLGLAKLHNPSYQTERWHNVLGCYLIAILITMFNIYCTKYLHYFMNFNLWFELACFVVTAIVLLACTDKKQSARFVFVDFQNDTGFESPGMAVMIGLLQCMYGMNCYDSPANMVEDMKYPTKDAPKAIITAVWLGGVTGFLYLMVCYFCIGDFEATANSPTGVPIIQIFYDSTGSKAATTFLTLLLCTGFLLAGLGLVAESSRALWAFARDNGLPASKTFAKISDSAVPRNTLILSCVVQMALNTIYIGSYEGFSTIIAFGSFGYYFSYSVPLAARLLGYFTGHVDIIPGPYSMGRWSPVVHAIGLAFLSFGLVVLSFPQVGPVTAANMNYCSAAFGAFGFISILTWFLSGRKHFVGPKINVRAFAE